MGGVEGRGLGRIPGYSYDNAMAKALDSVFKAELIDRRSRPTLTDVIVATSAWIGWYNNRRLHSALAHRPPKEVHQEWQTLQAYAA
ncbi:integrase core domain-containing protein [Corynebacterium pacaense]|uniref:integrase core domain-containing protein n=1 Tax=Corynebacterium pacaense TaxID=1816684 RepID=UPI003CCBC393